MSHQSGHSTSQGLLPLELGTQHDVDKLLTMEHSRPSLLTLIENFKFYLRKGREKAKQPLLPGSGENLVP